MSEMSLMVRKDSIDALSGESPSKIGCVYFLGTNCLNVYSNLGGQLSANCLVSDVHGRCPLHTDHNVLSAKKRRWQ